MWCVYVCMCGLYVVCIWCSVYVYVVCVGGVCSIRVVCMCVVCTYSVCGGGECVRIILRLTTGPLDQCCIVSQSS